MKIEKINNNQIRCTLTKADLIARQLKLSELAYGTEKAKSLFRDMMEQARDEFGFDAEDIPLMIEAIPMSGDSIVLVITKVDDPEELESKFSRISSVSGQSGLLDNASLALDKLDGADDSSPLNMVRIFSFQTLDSVIHAARVLNGVYDGSNSLYKDPDTMEYFLVVTKGDDERTAFYKVCNMLSEYGLQNLSTGATLAFLEEHCRTILSSNALQTLAEL